MIVNYIIIISEVGNKRQGVFKMNLAKTRKKAGLTQQMLSEKLGVSRALVAQIESGWRRPYPKFKRKVSEILNVEESKLFK